MKLLVLYQARNAAVDSVGYYDGFCRLAKERVLEDHKAISYWGVAEEKSWDGLWQEAYETARDMSADAIFLQFFHSRYMPDPTTGIERLKTLPTRPTLFTSLGDGFGKWSHRIPASFRVASRLSDVSFLTGMGYQADQLIGWGSRNLVLMPHGCCQVQFAKELDRQQYDPDFDVVFVGNRMRPRNPFGHCFYVDQKRARFADAFAKRYGRRFGLFGIKWQGNPSWQGPVPFAEQQSTMRRAHVVIGGLPGAYHAYYTSDREMIAMASGIPFVDYRLPGVDRLFRDGVDWWLADSIEGMIKLTDWLLDKSPEERLDLGEKARQLILGGHTKYDRCREMVQIVRTVRAARLAGAHAAEPHLSFLSNSNGRAGSEPPAVVGWTG